METTTVQVGIGDVLEYDGQARKVTSRHLSGHGWQTDGGAWFSDATIQNFVAAGIMVVSRAAPVTAGAPVEPPKGYRRCFMNGCRRWTSAGGACWHCTYKNEPNRIPVVEAKHGPDWSPAQPAPEAGKECSGQCFKGTANPNTWTVCIPCGKKVNGMIAAAKAKPVEAARPKCWSLTVHACGGPVLTRHISRGLTLAMCDAAYLTSETELATLNPSTAEPLPAGYTMPKPAPFVSAVDDFDLLPDA